MKLVCNVEVNHRGLLAGSNVAGKKSQSCLSIGKQNKNDELFIFLQSKPRNGNQMINKYKVIFYSKKLRKLYIYSFSLQNFRSVINKLSNKYKIVMN